MEEKALEVTQIYGFVIEISGGYYHIWSKEHGIIMLPI